MIAAQIETLDSLGGLVGVRTPAPATGAADFAGMLAAVTVISETEGLPPSPVDNVATPEKVSVARLSELKPIDPGAKLPIELAASEPPVMPAPRTGNPSRTAPPEALASVRPIEDVMAKDEPEIAVALDVVTSVGPAPVPTVSLMTPLLIALNESAENPTPPDARSRAAGRREEQPSLAVAEATIAITAPVLFNVEKPVIRARVEPTDIAVGVAVDQRALPSMLVPKPDQTALPAPDRLPMFAPLIADAVRDLVSIARDKDVRFNVRPEMLGSVAVTIQRGEAGLGLRLGVETLAAVQVVRQAEPMLTDGRGNAPFVQLTVDLNSSEQRGRPSRAAMIPKRGHDTLIHQTELLKAAPAGRYA